MLQNSSAQDTPSGEPDGDIFAEIAISAAAVPTIPAGQPAAVFAPSLVSQAAPFSSAQRVAVDSSIVASSDAAVATQETAPKAAPVRRLEVAVDDPLLGTVDVRAEMRGGALHAIVIGSQGSANGDMPALHQFLKQHDVTVQSLTCTTSSAVVSSASPTTFSSGDTGRDATGSSYSSGSDSGSQGTRGDGSQHPRKPQQFYGSDYGGIQFARSSARPAPEVVAAFVAQSMMSTGGTLSIHI